jgi:hypothetical protein
MVTASCRLSAEPVVNASSNWSAPRACFSCSTSSASLRRSVGHTRMPTRRAGNSTTPGSVSHRYLQCSEGVDGDGGPARQGALIYRVFVAVPDTPLLAVPNRSADLLRTHAPAASAFRPLLSPVLRLVRLPADASFCAALGAISASLERALRARVAEFCRTSRSDRRDLGGCRSRLTGGYPAAEEQGKQGDDGEHRQ